MLEQASLFGDQPEYDAFVAKFSPKKTTDDCYTPPLVYQAVADWACSEYGIDPEHIVRPFYPGGDFEAYPYPPGCVVLDNPPFSILTEICKFYLERGITFFLFCPGLTALSGRSVVMRTNHIICDANIRYENGAMVRTAFITNLGGDVIIQTAPELTAAIDQAVQETERNKKKTLQRYVYPMHVVTAAMLQRLSRRGIRFQVRRQDCAYISRLDSQAEQGKCIFGGGLLLSNRAAAEHADAERAADEQKPATVWRLSPRELELIKDLDRKAARMNGE